MLILSQTMDTAHPMAPEDLMPSSDDQSEPASTEVQFALVIARMIDSVKNSPADMRQAVYDLARYKLREQFTYADAKDIERTRQALEAAIRGVEEFSKLHAGSPAPTSPLQVDGARAVALTAGRPAPPALISRIRTRPHLQIEPPVSAAPKMAHVSWLHLGWALAVITVVMGLLIVVRQQDRLLSFTHDPPNFPAQTTSEPPRQSLAIASNPAPEPPAATPVPLRPTDYGVYAISNESLVELALLPGRPPDIRIAVSAALKIPNRTLLANGHPRFIVFRRDLVSNVSDHAEVRIVAKVTREFSVDAAGKKLADGDDTWVIRNVSFPFRSSPLEGNPEMVELHSEDPALELTSGRYALVLKNQAYDFAIDGQPSDPRHCIERIVAANGTFYSDCKKP